MDQVVWNLGDPDLGLPCDLVDMLFELPKVREGTDFQLFDPFRSHGAVRRDGLDQEQPVSLFVVEHHIRQLVMFSNRNAKVGQMISVQV